MRGGGGQTKQEGRHHHHHDDAPPPPPPHCILLPTTNHQPPTNHPPQPTKQRQPYLGLTALAYDPYLEGSLAPLALGFAGEIARSGAFAPSTEVAAETEVEAASRDAAAAPAAAAARSPVMAFGNGQLARSMGLPSLSDLASQLQSQLGGLQQLGQLGGGGGGARFGNGALIEAVTGRGN